MINHIGGLNYNKVRELIAEYSVELKYSGWGLEVYENKSTKTQIIIDWDTEHAKIKVGY